MGAPIGALHYTGEVLTQSSMTKSLLAALGVAGLLFLSSGCGDDAVESVDTDAQVEPDTQPGDEDAEISPSDAGEVRGPDPEDDVRPSEDDVGELDTLDPGPDDSASPDVEAPEADISDSEVEASDALADGATVDSVEEDSGAPEEDAPPAAEDTESAEDTVEVEDSSAVEDGGPSGDGCTSDADCLGLMSCHDGSCDLDSGDCVFTPKPDGAPCDDGTLCSEADTCQGGVCLGSVALECDDQNPCTDDICDPATGCVYANNFGACDDGDPCTGDDLCVGGQCAGTTSTCDDQNPCTLDHCLPSNGECIHTPDDTLPCSDGSACTGGDLCQGGACVPGPVDACDDGNDCTVDSCDEGFCKNFPLEDEPCDDGEVCTSGDVCILAVCVPGQPDACDDSNPCTIDSCEFGQGCVHEVTPDVSCDDDDVCTGEGVCDAEGACVSSTSLDCDDSNPCTVDDCHPQNGCVHAVKGGQCDDGNPCTAGDFCLAGQCKGQPATCNDDDACTHDSCDEVLGCQFTDISQSCSDDDLCTDDTCEPATGCVFVPNSAPCDDGLLCTEEDLCVEGICVGEQVVCTDDDVCTAETCDPEEGCVSVVTPGVSCDDGLLCTTAEACDAEGACSGGEPTSVDDGVACTFDACTEAEGIVHLQDDSLCEGGRVCDLDEGCVYSSGALLITKFAWTPDEGLRWVALVNTSELSIDLAGVVLSDGGAEVAELVPLSAEEAFILAPGATMAAVVAPGALPDASTEGFSAMIGSPEVPAPALLLGGGVLSLIDALGQEIDTLEIASVVDSGDVGPNDFPMHAGVASELDATATAVAADASSNDPAGLWCSWPAGAGEPEGPQLPCARVRLNEISLLGDEGARFVELHMPAGGSLEGLSLRVVSATGELLVQTDPLSGRTPMSSLVVLTDGVEGVALPQLGDGSLQLLRAGVLVDVCAFGALDVTQDLSFNLPMLEGSPASALDASLSLARTIDGQDSDDNAADWQLVAPTPGASNAGEDP